MGNRPGVTRWGLSWRRHAAVGLVETIMTAIDWNCRFRPDGPKLSRMSRERVSLALATINYAWTGEPNPAAALALLRQACRNKSVALPTAFDPFGAADFLGDASGNDLRKLGLELLADRPKPGELGYTARYQAHFGWMIMETTSPIIARFSGTRSAKMNVRRWVRCPTSCAIRAACPQRWLRPLVARTAFTRATTVSGVISHRRSP